jgi:hypothetical protein
VDIDGPGGEAKLQQISGGDLPETLEFTSGRDNGGRGLLYQIPAGVTLRTTTYHGEEKQELRFQAHGAQTVLPPSRHPSGSQYQWVDGHRPGEIEAALMPPWLVQQLAPSEHGERRRRDYAAGSATNGAGNGQKIPEGARNDTLARQAGTMRRKGMSEAAILAALLAEADSAKLDALLQEMHTDSEAVQKMLADMAATEGLSFPSAADADIKPPEEFAEYGEDIQTEHRCPRCGYVWSGKPA